MTTPLSIAVVPAQPDKEFYGTEDLALFQQFTRESYRAAFGLEAPSFDPDKAVKRWFDSAADVSHPSNVAIYKIAGRMPDGSYGMRQMVIPAADAAVVNLPGWGPFPPFVVAPTNAKRTGPGNLEPQPLNPEYLSEHQDAQRLMLELGGSAVVEEPELGGGFGTYFPAEESRRLWEVVVDGRRLNAGMLLKDRNANGVGAPGRWDKTGENPVWIPTAPPKVDETVQECDVPIRDLYPNEEFRVTLMGVGVGRKDLRKLSSESAGQFTSDDRAMLVAMYQAMFPSKK